MTRALVPLVALTLTAACGPHQRPRIPGIEVRLFVEAIDDRSHEQIAGAAVSVDDVAVGTTPARVHLRRGRHKIAVVTTDGRVTTFDTQINTSMRVRLDITAREDDDNHSAQKAESTKKGMEPAVIDATIKRHLRPIQHCFESRLAIEPKLHGKLVVHFHIEAQGEVGAAWVRISTMLDEDVEDCIAAEFRRITFPPPGDRISVNYPLLFKTS